jgi:hypothetical protein
VKSACTGSTPLTFCFAFNPTGAGDLRAPRHRPRDHLAVTEGARLDLEPDVLVHEEPLRVREAPHEMHEERPPPVRAGIRVLIDAAALERVVRVGHLGVADDVPPVDRDEGAAGDHRSEAGSRAVFAYREPGAIVDKPLVLDPDGAHVVGPAARVPGDVVERDELLHAPLAGDDEVRRGVRVWIPEPRNGAGERALRDVDDDEADRALLALRLRVVRQGRELAFRRRGSANARESERCEENADESAQIPHTWKNPRNRALCSEDSPASENPHKPLTGVERLQSPERTA